MAENVQGAVAAKPGVEPNPVVDAAASPSATKPAAGGQAAARPGEPGGFRALLPTGEFMEIPWAEANQRILRDARNEYQASMVAQEPKPAEPKKKEPEPEEDEDVLTDPAERAVAEVKKLKDELEEVKRKAAASDASRAQREYAEHITNQISGLMAKSEFVQALPEKNGVRSGYMDQIAREAVGIFANNMQQGVQIPIGHAFELAEARARNQVQAVVGEETRRAVRRFFASAEPAGGSPAIATPVKLSADDILSGRASEIISRRGPRE